MIGKSLLAVASALALSSFATAGEAKLEWKVGGEASAPAPIAPLASPVQGPAALPRKSDLPVSQKEMQVVAQAMSAHAAKNAGGKPSEQPKQSNKATRSSGQPVAVPQLKAVAMAIKAHAEKNAGGKPSEQPKASATGGVASAAQATSRPGPELKAVATAARAHAERNASGRPSETPRGESRGWNRERSSFGGFGGSRGERSPTFRGSPMERIRSHCNARGMCF